MLQHIINPDRRDPSRFRTKAELGLAKVDNISVSEYLDLSKDLVKNEVWRGDIYSIPKIKGNLQFELLLCEFISECTQLKVTISFLTEKFQVFSEISGKIQHTYDTLGCYSNNDLETFKLEKDFLGCIAINNMNNVGFRLYKPNKGTTGKAVLSFVAPPNLLTQYNVTAIAVRFTDYSVFSDGVNEYMGFNRLTSELKIGDSLGNLSDNYTCEDYL